MKVTDLFEAVQLDLAAIAAELKKAASIESVDVKRKSLHVKTKKGDAATFNEHGEALYAWVQGQKNDIDVGAIGSSAKDILQFLKGINTKWYKEYEHFDS